MKKVYSLLLLVFICTMTSCSVKIKEPKVKGDKLSTEQMQQVVDKYNAYESEGFHKYYNKWYNVDQKITMYVKETSSNVDLNMEATIDGEIYNAEYDYDKKLRLEMKCNIEGSVQDPANSSETIDVKIKYTIDMKMLEGRSYVKIKLDAKTELGKMNFTLYDNADDIDDKLDDAMDVLNEILDTSALGQLVTLDIMEAVAESLEGDYIIELIDEAISDENTMVYNKKKAYSILKVETEDEFGIKSVNKGVMNVKFLKDSYQIKDLEQYVYYNLEGEGNKMDCKSILTIKAKLFGGISKPSNEGKYNY